MTPPLYISFHTPAYAAEAAGLVEALKRFDLEHDVRAVPDLGSWRWNCGYKPTFIRRMREEHPKRHLVWLDADSRLLAKPDLFDQLDRYDFAAHYFRDTQLASGTMYFGCTPESYELARRWEWRQSREREALDQATLQIESEAMPGLRVALLPASYCFMDQLTPGDVKPVVFHRQKSRIKCAV